MYLLIGEQTCHYTSYRQRGKNIRGSRPLLSRGTGLLPPAGCSHLLAKLLTASQDFERLASSPACSRVFNSMLLVC
jgi:hypothetical protein